MRAAIYARYSDPRQSAQSIRDQVALCRVLAAAEGYSVVEIYTDAAISGAATGNRPGYLQLMRDAKAGKFDVVVVEALDRFSRGLADIAGAFEDLRDHGVTMHTLAEGKVDELHIGLKGTMNALFLKDLGAKTHRGLSGVIGEGRAISTPYGYKVVRKIGDNGEVLVGLREIDPGKAAIVRRIFADYVAGLSPQKIANALNGEHIPAPMGGEWRGGLLVAKGRGMLYNETYRGVLAWGRTKWRKDRGTGKRRSALNGEDKVIRSERPDLRIIDDATWSRVQALLAAQSAKTTSRVHATRRPKRLLSGVVMCGVCGSTMTLSAGEAVAGAHAARFRCSGRLTKGANFCANGGTVPMVDAERRVLAAVRDRLLRPEAIDAVVREVHRLVAERSRTAGADRDRLERELADVRRRADRLVDQVAEGFLSGSTVRGKILELEARATVLERELRQIDDNGKVVTLHPAAADHYRRLVDDLGAKLDGDSAAEISAREAFRQLIGKVRMIPGQARGQYELEIVGRLQNVMAFVAGGAIDTAQGGDLGEYRILG